MIKIIYYVDMDDNTKTCLCALPEDTHDSPDAVNFVSKEIHGVFDAFRESIKSQAEDIARAILRTGIAEIEDYAFGTEDVPVLQGK